jgi:Regulator of G protein signaling domain
VNAMESDQPSRARPISMSTRREGLMSPGRPTLEDVLNNTAPSPYTLSAYTAFLSQQHCLETLEFVTESRKYSAKYEEAAAQLKESKVTTESDQGFDLMMDWTRLLDVYVKPGAPREINLPAEERDDLIACSYEPTLPPPEALDPSVKRMYDLMSDSIFIPFCNSLKAPSHAQTYTAISELSSRMDMEPSKTFDDRGAMHRRVQSNSQSQRSPPSTSGSAFEPSRSPTGHRPTQSSSLSSALGKQTANRLSTHMSHSSVMSESALTDSSGGGGPGDTPPPGEDESVMTPPTTPPTSDLGTTSTRPHGGPTSEPMSNAVKPQRSESGGWSKKMNKFFGGGGAGSKKRSSFLE